LSELSQAKIKIAKRAVREIKDGLVVNLGVGLPSYIKAFLPENNRAFVHGENGVLGMTARQNAG
jgi:acetate CoA/acetoacetate CoA-transferase beta subunit